MVCDVAVDNCDPPFDLWCELTSSNKAKLHWEAPLYDSVSWYYVMRKLNADDEWKRVQILRLNKLEYTDNIVVGAGKCYFYKVVAKYLDPECFSPPAKAKYNDEFFVRACNTTNLEENVSGQVLVYPNPVKDIVKLSAVSGHLSVVKIYNMMGILMDEFEFSSDEVEINVSNYNSVFYFFNVDGNVIKVIKN